MPHQTRSQHCHTASTGIPAPDKTATVRIVCISDTHGSHKRVNVPKGDILIHSGDFMTYGRLADEVADFNRWLGEQPHRHKIVVAGNHDRLFESRPDEARGFLTNAIYLENTGAVVEGLSFWGSPVTPVFNDWAFNVERGAAIRRYWDKIPSGTDVLITHGPPFGSLDKADILSAHLGCEELTKAVVRIKPKLHIFGHIHGGYGQETGPNGTRLVNCAVLNENYALTNEPVVIELNRKEE